MSNKFKSRKFWICVAAFLSSIATSIAGISCDSEIVTTIGLVCGVFAAAIYSACEAYVDGKGVGLPEQGVVLEEVPVTDLLKEHNIMTHQKVMYPNKKEGSTVTLKEPPIQEDNEENIDSVTSTSDDEEEGEDDMKGV